MPNLFNKKILNNRIKDYSVENIDEKIEKIKNWQQSLSKIKGLNEKRLQSAFLKAIFEDILGYENSPQKEEWTLDIEATTDVDAKHPDGILGFFERVDNEEIRGHEGVIELKGPQISLDKDQKRQGTTYKSPVDQAFSYTNKLDKCKWVIVSNFMEIRLYKVGRSKEYYEVFLLDELDEIENFKKFYYLLNKTNLLSETVESVTYKLSEKTLKKEEDISVKFYNLYKNVRINLFEHLKNNNPDKNPELLLEKAQKFLDRIIFIGFCEDKGLLPNDLLHEAIQRGKESFSPGNTAVWDQIRGVFRSIDEGNAAHNINAYNGGLFKHDKDLDGLIIENEFFQSIYKISDYDFDSDVDVNILGHIFEQSISDLEKLKSDIKDDEFDKSESKRKKDGIFYTPQYITSYIVENAIGGYLENLKEDLGYYELPDIENAGSDSWETRYTNQHLEFYNKYEEKIKEIKILDPACGSGAFLNQAFDYLLEEHNWLNKQRDLLKGGQSSIFALDSVQRNILKNNIYGVDLNEESVEITKLSLWLKTANKNKPLTNLDDNIKCGNSLIDDPEIAADKAFEWKNKFENIMNKGGFDIVVGNPPYVFARNNSFSEEEKEYYYNNYELNSYQLNTFVLFMEKGIELLKETGWFGYIIPNNWLTINSFKKLRKYILKNMKNIQIINTHDDVFSDASVDSCVNIWSKNGENKVSVGEYKKEFTELIELEPEFFLNDEDHIINISMAKKKNIKEILNKINNNSIFLKSAVEEVVSGLQAYEVGKGTPPQTESMRDNRIYHSETKENDDYYPYVHGRDVKRYFLAESETFLKYGDHLAAPREIYKFSSPRILVRQIPDTPPYCIHAIYTDKIILNDRNSNNILGFDDINPLFILGIINSRLVSFWFEYTFDKFQRDIYPQFKVNELERFPIRTEGTNNINDVLISNVKNIISNKDKLKKMDKLKFKEIYSKYSSKNGLNLKDIIEISDFKNELYSGRARKIRNYTVNINTNIVTIYLDKSSSGKYEVLKFEENDRYKRQYLKYYLENLTDEQLDEIDDKYKGNILKKTLQIEIPDYNKVHVVKKVVKEWDSLQQEINNLENEIERIDNEIDQMVYKLYNLTEEEIKIVENE